MKRLAYIVTALVGVMMLFPAAAVWAQKAAPQVSVTYPGDTNETIMRRAKWIEAAKKEGEVVWWDSYNAEVFNKIAAEFGKIYPFLKLTFWRGQDKERDTRLEVENSAGRLSADLIGAGDVTLLPRWREIALLDGYTDIIPDIKNMDKRMYSKYGDWAIAGNNATVPMYNTRLVSAAEAPKNWEGLLDPKWKGQIGVMKNMRTWFTLALAEGGWGIEKTEAFLKRLKQQQPSWAPGVAAGFSLLGAGEYKVVSESFLRYTFTAKKKQIPIEWVRVNPVPVTGGFFVLAKKAPHPNAARLLIEWLFSPQGLAFYENATGYGSAYPGSGTKLAKTLEGLHLAFRTEEVILKAAQLNLDDRFAQILGITPK